MAQLEDASQNLPAALSAPYLCNLSDSDAEGHFVTRRGFCPSCGARRMVETAALTAVLGIVYRAIAAHLIRRAGLTQSVAQCGAVTLIQRFGSALNLDRDDTVLDHMLSHSIRE